MAQALIVMSISSLKSKFGSLVQPINWRRTGIIIILLMLAAGSFITYQTGRQYIAKTETQILQLENKQTELLASFAQQQQQRIADKKTWEVSLKTNQDKITELEKQIVELEKKIAANRIAAAPKPVATKSVYDRIITDDATAKQKLIDAIKLIENGAPTHFAILKNQVQEIRTVDYIGCAGGVQTKRVISISIDSSDCLSDTPTSTFASVIVHEAYHVYNVYVLKVTVTGKNQELPSLYAQRDTFDALGVTQSFRNHVNSLIAYYESL